MFEIEKVKELYENLKEFVIDILIFGSAIKGKEKPKDIDILVIIKDKKFFGEILNKIPSNFNAIILTPEELIYERFFLKNIILFESFSIKKNKWFSEIFFEGVNMLYELYLKNPSESKRVLLYYFLKKRRDILSKVNGTLLKVKYVGRAEHPTYVVKIPVKYSSYFEEELKKYCREKGIRLKVNRKILIDAETLFL